MKSNIDNFASVLHQHGIRGNQWGALRAIQEASEKGVAVGNLQPDFANSRAGATVLADQLEKLHLISRIYPSAGYRKGVQLHITTTGTALIETILSEAQ